MPLSELIILVGSSIIRKHAAAAPEWLCCKGRQQGHILREQGPACGEIVQWGGCTSHQGPERDRRLCTHAAMAMCQAPAGVSVHWQSPSVGPDAVTDRML